MGRDRAVESHAEMTYRKRDYFKLLLVLPTTITPSTSAAVTSVKHPFWGEERAQLIGSHTQLTLRQSKSFKSQLLHFWKTRKSPPPLICLHKPPPPSRCLSEMATICSSSLCWQPQVGNLTSPAWCCTATAQGWGTDSSFERFARVQVPGNHKLTSAPTAPRQGTPSTWLTLFL